MSETPPSTFEPPKVDRRILRTRQALRQALLELIQEKGFEAVSVEEITERANLGRATFYLHYKDKEDLLLEEFREIASNRVRALSEVPISIWKTEPETLEAGRGRTPVMPLLLIFEHAAQNATLYRILLRGQSSQRIAGQIQAIIGNSIYEIIRTKQQTDEPLIPLEVSVEMLAAYFSGALMSTLNWWLEEEHPAPAEDMARMFQRLFFPGVKKVMRTDLLNQAEKG